MTDPELTRVNLTPDSILNHYDEPILPYRILFFFPLGTNDKMLQVCSAVVLVTYCCIKDSLKQ